MGLSCTKFVLLLGLVQGTGHNHVHCEKLVDCISYQRKVEVSSNPF